MKKCIYEQKKRRGKGNGDVMAIRIGNCGKLIAIERRRGGCETEK